MANSLFNTHEYDVKQLTLWEIDYDVELNVVHIVCMQNKI